MNKMRFLGVARFRATRRSINAALKALKDQHEAQEAMALGGSLRATEYGRSSLHDAQAVIYQYADVCEALASTAQALDVALSDLTAEMACEAGYIDVLDESDVAA